jgi:hypothetical protein
MFLVPYRRIHVVSPHSAEVIAERLRLHTSRRWPWFRSPAPQFDFVGKVSLNGFRLVPAIRDRNTYQPWVLGRMTPRPDGTEIQIVQTLHPTGIVIIVSFLILALVLWSRAGYYGGAALFTAGLIVLHGVMYCIRFWPQARRAEERIRQLATKVESGTPPKKWTARAQSFLLV